MELKEGKTYKLGKGRIKILEINETDVKVEYNGKEYPNCDINSLTELIKKDG